MSLKGFHIFFITISSLAAIAFGVWCFATPAAASQTFYKVTGALSIVVGIGLIVYGKSFLAKMKREGI